MAENIEKFGNPFGLSGGFNIYSNQSMDSRFKVQTLDALTKEWVDLNDNTKKILKYEGLLTFVESEGKTFRYRTGASYTQGETTIENWELVPVTADDINSLVEIPVVENVEYTLESGETNSIKLLKNNESVGEVSISLTADVVKSDDPNTELVTALSKATKENVGKIILVSSEPEESEYLNGTYIIDGIGSVKYLATTTGSSAEASTEELIDNAIKELDSIISATEGEVITGITITDGKLTSVDSTKLPEYSVSETYNEAGKYTEYNLTKDGVSVGTSIKVNDSEITFEEGDIIIADKHVLITSDLDDYKIKDVVDTDKILTVDTDGKLSSTISLKHGTITEEVEGETVTYPTIELIGKGEQVISYIGVSDFIKDGFLISASYNNETYQLTLTWNTEAGVETTNIDLTDLVHGLESESEETDLVKVEISNNSDTKPENEPFKYIVSIDETNLQNKLDEIDGKFDDYLTYDNIDTTKNEGTLVDISLNVDENNKLSVSLDETKLGEKITDVEGRITELENAVDADTKCTSATINAAEATTPETDEVDVISKQDIILTGDGTSLETEQPIETVKVVTKKYVDDKFDSLTDSDTKCTSATINADTEIEEPTVDEVDVLKNVDIELTGDGTSLTGTATAVKVVTKQYVDDKFDELPTYEVITTAEIDSLFD